ncbi:MAG: nuclear transport factor 2 family protein [Candidatus Xenobia bacterium]
MLIGFALVFSLLAAPVRAQGTDPTGTCNQFMKAMQSRDWQAAYNCFSKSFQQTHPFQGWSLMYATYAPMFTIERWRVDVHEKGDTASGTIAVTSRSGEDEGNQENVVSLVKENGQWKIGQYETRQH